MNIRIRTFGAWMCHAVPRPDASPKTFKLFLLSSLASHLNGLRFTSCLCLSSFVIITFFASKFPTIDLLQRCCFLFASCKQLMTIMRTKASLECEWKGIWFHAVSPFVSAFVPGYWNYALRRSEKSHKRLKIYCFNRIHSFSSSPFMLNFRFFFVLAVSGVA